MLEENSLDLFELGQKYFDHFLAEFASYGLEADPGIELRKGTGILCYYSFDDRHVYLSAPDLDDPIGRLHALLLRSMVGCSSDEELLRFFRLFIPYIIAHELAHHYRHRAGLFGDSLWHEEQVANKLAVAVVKHRLSPDEKSYARQLLLQAIETLSAKMEEKNIAADSYYSLLHALNVSGQIGVSDFENIELIGTIFNMSPDEILLGSGQLSPELLGRLEQRDDLIEQINEEYASDQLRYIYYHVGWLYLDLTSRETGYVDEFARTYLNKPVDLLPAIPAQPNPQDREILACYRAYLDTAGRSEAAGRYFYRRYRSLLLARLQEVQLQAPGQAEQLKQEARLILERWTGQEADTLRYLAQLAPTDLRPLFPHRIEAGLGDGPELPASLPAETDRRLWQYVTGRADDSAAANTLHRLALLDQTDIYRPLPAEMLLELARQFYYVRYAAGEVVIWENERNDDVYILLEGRLEATVRRDGQDAPVNVIRAGDIFGEIAFFTEDPRYATVRALEPSQCFVLKDSQLQLFAFEHPVILMQMAGALAKRLADTYKSSRKETV